VRHLSAKRFSAVGSRDPFPGGRITRYAWNFGDGHTATGRRASHTYATRGTRTITLKVTDSYGFTGVVKRRVSVR
jgi:PKD repeat protein